MKMICEYLHIPIYWKESTKTIYVRINVKVRDLDWLRNHFYTQGYYFNNLVIGKNYDGEGE